jgi:malate/lactate dehydrogenase
MRVGIIGAAGKVGSSIAYSLVNKVDELVLVDIAKEKVEGEYLDLGQASDNTKLSWGVDSSDAKKCDVVIIPAGFPRTPDMKTRMDLLKKNAPILKDIVEKVSNCSPKSILVIISNPVDVMTYLSLKVSGFESSRVIGMGGTLDSRRFKWVLSQHLPGKINAITIGEHGDSMIPLLSQVKIDGKSIAREFIEKNRKKIVQEVRQASMKIIHTKGGTWWCPAQATLDVLDAILNGPKVIPVSVFYKNCCIGLPAEVGLKGVRKIIQPEMDPWESSQFKECVDSLNENCRWVDQWLE